MDSKADGKETASTRDNPQIMTRNTPVFFKVKPSFTRLTGNAVFLRDMGEVQGQSVCEIEYLGQRWLVRLSEIKEASIAHNELANDLHAEIEAATALAIKKYGKPFKVRIAFLMTPSISAKTLNKRIEFVEKYSSDYKAALQ